MATANPLLDPAQYEPIPVPPPGGLLASAVGTPLQPQPPLDPNVAENDDVVGALNAITNADSGYMQLARTSGLQTANKRGLLNSSIAAGASQAAAIAAAAPLAQQQAGQAASRNLARLQGVITGQQQQVDIAAREKMLQEQLKSEEERLGRQLTSQEQMQLRDISNRLEMQGIDIGAQREMQQRSIASAENIANMNIQAESERLGRTLTAQEQQQIRDLAAQQARLQEQLAMQKELTLKGYQTDIQRTQLENANRLALSSQQIQSANQQAALQYYLGQDQIYAQSVSNLYANAEMPAPARDAAIQQFVSLKNSGINLPSQLFGTSLNWGTGTSTGSGTTAPAYTPVPTTPSSGTGLLSPPTTTTRPPLRGNYPPTAAGGDAYRAARDLYQASR